MEGVSYLLRVTLTDRPGSLGLLAVQLGAVGADIRSLEVIERGEAYAVDDIVVDLPHGSLPDTLITAAEKVDGVNVDSLRPFGGMLDIHQELELIDEVATDKKNRLQILADRAPHSLNVSWAMVLSRPGTEVVRLAASGGAPETPLQQVPWLPLPQAGDFAADEDWIPQAWQELDIRLAAAPLGDGSKALLLGRTGGPDFRPSEVARIGHLAGIVSTLLKK